MPTLMLDALVAVVAVTLRCCLPTSIRVSMADLESSWPPTAGAGSSCPAERLRIVHLASNRT